MHRFFFSLLLFFSLLDISVAQQYDCSADTAQVATCLAEAGWTHDDRFRVDCGKCILQNFLFPGGGGTCADFDGACNAAESGCTASCGPCLEEHLNYLICINGGQLVGPPYDICTCNTRTTVDDTICSARGVGGIVLGQKCA